MRVKDAIRFIIDSCRDIYGPGESESIAYIILDFIGFQRKFIFLNGDTILESANEEFIRKVASELKSSKPVQYILGETEFYGLKFRLNQHVLIPRQETEELVQRVAKENRKSAPSILDLGTGSGCIAISLAKNIPGSKITATDISPQAIAIAGGNALQNSVKVNFFTDDMLKTQLESEMKYDVIVSNPPYVRFSEKKLMRKNVLDFEPHLALFVEDENPLVYYIAIAQISMERLFEGGFLYVEINENLGREVCRVFMEKGFEKAEIIKDLHEKDRFVKAIKPKK